MLQPNNKVKLKSNVNERDIKGLKKKCFINSNGVIIRTCAFRLQLVQFEIDNEYYFIPDRYLELRRN